MLQTTLESIRKTEPSSKRMRFIEFLLENNVPRSSININGDEYKYANKRVYVTKKQSDFKIYTNRFDVRDRESALKYYFN